MDKPPRQAPTLTNGDWLEFGRENLSKPAENFYFPLVSQVRACLDGSVYPKLCLPLNFAKQRRANDKDILKTAFQTDF